jgi:hypothetical protein
MKEYLFSGHPRKYTFFIIHLLKKLFSLSKIDNEGMVSSRPQSAKSALGTNKYSDSKVSNSFGKIKISKKI